MPARTVLLSPDSRLRVADPAPSRGLVQMFTDRGTATFQVGNAAQMFAVSTPYLAAAGHSAQFTVTVSNQGRAGEGARRRRAGHHA